MEGAYRPRQQSLHWVEGIKTFKTFNARHPLYSSCFCVFGEFYSRLRQNYQTGREDAYPTLLTPPLLNHHPDTIKTHKFSAPLVSSPPPSQSITSKPTLLAYIKTFLSLHTQRIWLAKPSSPILIFDTETGQKTELGFHKAGVHCYVTLYTTVSHEDILQSYYETLRHATVHGCYKTNI